MDFNKRHNTSRTFKDVFDAFVKRQQDPDAYKKGKLVNAWKDIVGSTIAKRTTKIYVRDKTLIVHLESSVMKNELHFLREAILEKINTMIGEGIIEKIIFK